MFSLLTYEDGNSPAMKRIRHISVNKLVGVSHDIIQNKQQCQTIEYDRQFTCCSCEISVKKWKEKYGEKTQKKNMYMIAWNLLPKKVCRRNSKEVFNNGSYKKERIIWQTQTKLPIFRWYREGKKYFTNAKKNTNPWMRQRRKNYFRNA